MLCKLHTLYKIIHCVALHTLLYYTESVKLLHRKVSFFCVHSGKIYTGQKKFTRAPPVVPVTNMRYGFVLTNYDLFMVRKSILTPFIQKKHLLRDPEVDPFIKFYSYFNDVAQPNLHSWIGFDLLIIFLVKFWWFSCFLLPL